MPMTNHSHPASAHDPLVEALVVKLARLYAPQIVPAAWQRPGGLGEPLPALARRLARAGVLVVLGDRSSVPPEAVPQAVAECVQAYTVLYALLTQRLFPNQTGIKPYYYSYSRRALVIFFVAEAAPAIQALAGYVAPYAAAHTPGARVPARQLVALMDTVLKQLDTAALAPSQRQNLRNNGAATINWMLGRALRQLPLLPYDVPPETAAPPPPPTTLPGISAAATPPHLSPDADNSTTEVMPSSDAGDTTLPPLPPAPGPPPASDAPPAPVPYRPGRRRDDAGAG